MFNFGPKYGPDLDRSLEEFLVHSSFAPPPPPPPGWLFSAFLVCAVSRVLRKSNVCLDNCNGSYYAVHMYFGVSNMKDESNFPLKTTYN